MRLVIAVGMVLPILLGAPAFAVADALDMGVRKCAAVPDQTARLACYDALAASLPAIEADRIGMTRQLEEKRKAAPAPASAIALAPVAASKSLTAKIVSAQENNRGLFVFSLDNDQVWVQDQPSINLRFNTGETVHIEHGALSALWLTADHGRKVRVKRLR